MSKINTIAKSIAVGAVVGSAVYTMTNAKNKRSKALKKKATRAARTVGTMISDISSMMG